MNGREMIRALEAAGFIVDEQEGSHVTLYNPVTDRHTTVPVHGSRDLRIGTEANILRQAGLTVQQFRELLK